MQNPTKVQVVASLPIRSIVREDDVIDYLADDDVTTQMSRVAMDARTLNGAERLALDVLRKELKEKAQRSHAVLCLRLSAVEAL